MDNKTLLSVVKKFSFSTHASVLSLTMNFVITLPKWSADPPGYLTYLEEYNV